LDGEGSGDPVHRMAASLGMVAFRAILLPWIYLSKTSLADSLRRADLCCVKEVAGS
jgi:hypothetical protein